MGDVVPLGRKYVSRVERLVKSSKKDFKRGLIIGLPPEVSRGHEQRELIFQEGLRRSILFWDRLAWPTNDGFMMPGGPEIDFLEDIGFLERPHYRGFEGLQEQIFLDCYRTCFQEFECRDPGAWAVALEPNAADPDKYLFEVGRGAEVELVRAVPVPRVEMPLEEVLEFRLKRQNEVTAFMNEKAEFFQRWVNSEDQAHQLRLAQSRIERACLDLIGVSRECKYPFSYSNWNIGYVFGAVTSVATYSALEGLSKLAAYPFVNEALTGVSGAALLVHKANGPKKRQIKSSPYRYAVSIDQKLGNALEV